MKITARKSKFTKSKSNAYYAHSMRKYNSIDEAEERAFIQKKISGEVICPNLNLGELGDIEHYLEVIKSVECVYATEFKGYIGRGVFDECEFALKNKINVFVVRKDLKGKFFVQEVIDVVVINSFNYVSYGCLITK
jgi:hypothetical protein